MFREEMVTAVSVRNGSGGTIRAVLLDRRMHKHTLIEWLNGAHAMETQSLPILRAQVSDARKTADARARFQAHLRETEQHAARIQQALQNLGSAPPLSPNAGDSVAATALGLSTRWLVAPLARLAIADFVAEQFEVATYTALIAAAERAGETQVARLCRLNRGEDEDMAEWLDAQIPIAIERALTEVPPNRR